MSEHEHVHVPWLCGYAVDVPGQGEIKPGDLVLMPATEAAASDNFGDPVKLETLPKTELEQMAAEQGVDTTGVKGKGKLAAEIKKADG